MANGEAFICRDHSGVVSDLKHLQDSDKKQWASISEIQKLQNKIFGGVILLLAGTIVNLVIQFVK